MTVTHGNDPVVLDGIADALRAQADRVETISGTGSSGVAVLVEAWAGPDLEVFGENWRGAQQQLESASQLLRAVGERAREQAQQQRDSSGEGGGGGGGAPWLPGPNADRTLPTPDAPPLN
uniref:WXG100 family type VII secretion target n=1 Tax=Janibacter anophelis TaxID=319054 RepID=UPI003B8A66C8